MSATIFLTTTGTHNWTVPSDWNNASNSIEVIGAGAGGAANTAQGKNAPGGGGGGYAKITNLSLTPGNSISYTIGTGGTSVSGNSNGIAGLNSYFNGASIGAASVGAYGGGGGTASSKGAGGTGTGSGATTYLGGDGPYDNSSAYGAGGAAGPNGNGGNGTAFTGGGTGLGGNGDAGFGGTGGSLNSPGGNGSEYDGSHGSGGGGGYGGAAGGSYGGGGSGNAGGSSGAGYQGLIVINYTGYHSLSVTVGSFALTGSITSFGRAYTAPLSYGLFHLTGINIGFVYNGNYIFSVTTGLFTLTGYSATLSTGFVPLLAGIFSLVVSPSMLGETASGLVMEAQNSYGLAPIGGSLSNGILIDNSPSANGNDSYYSVWSNGSVVGGIDYNDTSLWHNYEPTIETDIIPLGSILDKKTLGQIMFKLDRPMTTGDFIKVWARGSLTDVYTLVGTTSTNQLSENLPSNLAQMQWIQFMIQFKCAASGSSRIPFRELRVQMK